MIGIIIGLLIAIIILLVEILFKLIKLKGNSVIDRVENNIKSFKKQDEGSIIKRDDTNKIINNILKNND